MHQVQRRPQRGWPERRWTPASVLSGSRFVLAAVLGVAVLADAPRWLLAVVVGTALLTDLADGRLARATGTVTLLGARLDQEADAFLILVLSAAAAAEVGVWVLAIGAARYVFGAAFLAPRLRTPPPRARPWCRTVAAVTGVVLAAVVVLPLPHLVARVALGVVAVLLAESFVHEAVDRWRAPHEPWRVPTTTVLSLLSGLVVWFALVAPALRDDVRVGALARVPVEAVLVAALALLPWRRVRLALAGAVGVLLALLLLVTVLDVGFRIVFDRDFDPVGDWSLLGPGVGVLGVSIGSGWASAVAVLAGVAVLAVLVVLPLATGRVVRDAAEHRRPVLVAAVVLLTVGLLPGVPASPVAATLAVDEAGLVRANLADTRAFAEQVAHDPYAERSPDSLLAGLAGKDVLLVFVESYGRVAVQDTPYSRGVAAVLDRGTRELTARGYRSRSAFLTSPTFGGASWLAHSSLQSGLWVDSQRRYRQLLGADRLTLTRLFGRAGWRTAFDVPADTEDWPEGREFYGFEQYYDSRNVGYAGPRFGYAPIPDQFTLDAFGRRELAPPVRRPVMAEIDLVSSHHPWTPLPRLVPWDQVGDGSVYDGMPEEGTASSEAILDPEAAGRLYGASLEYSWRALTSFLTSWADPDLVVVVLGDHQPHGYVSGEDAGHDVPVSVITQDPAVLRRTDPWGWQDGLRPAPDATVWRMDTFRDRFLEAFSR